MYYDYAMAAPLMTGEKNVSDMDVLILGMGTGTYATQCNKYFGNMKIEGVENDILFQLMDGISNAVSDSCVPQIIPDIEPQTVEGKTVIVVSVEAGKNRPYYLKSKGKDNGTYIRVAGTSRQAFPE